MGNDIVEVGNVVEKEQKNGKVLVEDVWLIHLSRVPIPQLREL
jgi:hypothetical protein